MTDNDPPPISGRLILADGTEQPLTAVYFGLDADGVAIYRALATVASLAAVDGCQAIFDRLPARSSVQVMITPAEQPAQYETPPTACPSCRARVSGATHVGGPAGPRAPHPGAATVCAYCAAPAVYDDELQLRHPTDAELADLLADPRFVQLRDATLRSIGGRR